MTINFVAIAKKDDKGFRIKSSYSENVEFRERLKKLTIDLLSSLEGNYRIEEKLSSSNECFYAKKCNSSVHVVVTSANYPYWLAVECIDELSALTSSSNEVLFQKLWHSQEERNRIKLQHCVHIVAKYSHDEPGCVLYDMRMMDENSTGNESTIDNNAMGMVPYSPEHWQQRNTYQQTVERYLEDRDNQAYQSRLTETHEKVEEIMTTMLTTIMLTEMNMIHAQKLKNDADELLKQAMIFRKNAATLRRKMQVPTMFAIAFTVGTTMAVAGAGGAIALAVGGDGIGFVVGTMFGGAFGYQLSDAETTEWFYALPRIVLKRLTEEI